MDKAYKTFTQAIRDGWKPELDIDATIRNDAQLTWFPTHDMIVVASDKGAIHLEESDLVEAIKYNKGVAHAKDN